MSSFREFNEKQIGSKLTLIEQRQIGISSLEHQRRSKLPAHSNVS